MSLSIIIPSRNARNLSACVHQARERDDASLIVIDDGLPLDWYDSGVLDKIDGVKPFVYARNCNRGIVSCGLDDVILLNDDALLKTPRGFSAMQTAAAQHPEYGIIAATTNVTGYRDQLPHTVPGERRETCSIAPLRETSHVAFLCVLIPRRTIDVVGLLDERFVTYGWEDVDYCRRVRNAGLKVGVFDGCFVDHSSLPSTFRGAAPGNAAPGDIEPGRQIYLEKWGTLDVPLWEHAAQSSAAAIMDGRAAAIRGCMRARHADLWALYG